MGACCMCLGLKHVILLVIVTIDAPVQCFERGEGE